MYRCYTYERSWIEVVVISLNFNNIRKYIPYCLKKNLIETFWCQKIESFSRIDKITCIYIGSSELIKNVLSQTMEFSNKGGIVTACIANTPLPNTSQSSKEIRPQFWRKSAQS